MNTRFSVQAQGDSMYPLLQDGDLVEYERVPFSKISVHDIVLTYGKEKEAFVTHRVIYKTLSFLITKGDNNPTADERIKKGQILARVVRFKRKGAWYGISDVYLAQSAIYLHEIQQLETLLRKSKIPHVFLKGVLVSLRYEGTIPKRIYADCDILVNREEYRKIVQVFKQLGYTLFLEQALFLSSQKNPEDRSEVNFIKRVNGVPVVFDVHFEPVFLMPWIQSIGFLYPSSLLQKLGRALVSRGQAVAIKGSTYSLCNISDQILYLALHIYNHNFVGSIRYQLLSLIIKKKASKKTFDELSKTIREYKLEGYAYPVFLLLNAHYKKIVPPSFLSSIAPSAFKTSIALRAMSKVNIFDAYDSSFTRMKRFVLTFLLSGEPIGKKIFFVFHPKVIWSLGTIIWTKIHKKDI